MLEGTSSVWLSLLHVKTILVFPHSGAAVVNHPRDCSSVFDVADVHCSTSSEVSRVCWVSRSMLLQVRGQQASSRRRSFREPTICSC